MATKPFSSANNDISVAGSSARGSLLGAASSGNAVKKRWLIVGTGIAVTISAVAALMSGGGGPQKTAANPDSKTFDTTPKGLNSQNDWKAQTGAEVQALRKGLADSQTAQKELLARMESLRQEVAQGKTATAAAPTAGPANRIDFTLPPPPEPPRLGGGPKLSAPPGMVGAPVTSSGGFTPPPAEAATVVTAPVPRRPARAFIPAPSPVESAEPGLSGRVDELIPNDKNGFLPAGSFATATLISGVEAFTGGTAQAQPQPVVVHIDANAVLPNSADYQIKGCHVLASVYGDMSSERVFGRLATLTCVDSKNRLVLSEEVEGNLIDSDGKNGIRGVLQDRQGAKLGRALLAGFAKGMGAAFGAAQSTTTATAAGLTSALTGDAFKASGYSGASTAANQLAEFYMKQAEATMPIIAVDAGRKISVLFTKSKALRFETINTYKIEPSKKLQVERR